MPAAAPNSLSLAVEPRRRACVLDAALALSPYGLPLAQRLSAELDLWLPREFWQILDNSAFYLDRPESLLPAGAGGRERPGDAARRVLLQESIRQWDVARAEKDLAGLNVFWVGDALASSLLPPCSSAQLSSRFDVLGRALEAHAAAPRHEPALVPLESDPGTLESCARDAAALTVALSAHRAFILTAYEPDEERPRGDRGVRRRAASGGPQRAAARAPAFAAAPAPELCELLCRWGVECEPVSARWTTQMERDFFEPLLARAGVAELLWAGRFGLAAVHVVARRAAAIPALSLTTADIGDDEMLAADDDDESALDWWDGARAFWYPLTLS